MFKLIHVEGSNFSSKTISFINVFQVAASWFVAILFFGLLMCRLVTLVLKAVNETSCFFEIQSLHCRNFTIFSFKEENTASWLCASVITSAICLIALPTIPEFQGYVRIACYPFKTKCSALFNHCNKINHFEIYSCR